MLLVSGSEIVFAQVGMPNNSANANAVLDLNTTSGTANKGLLLPRVALTAITSASPLAAHTAGMHVYNTATAGTGDAKVVPGEYYNDGTQWVRISSVAWSTNGNTGTNADMNGLGTTDVSDLAFRVNNTESMRVTVGGNTLIGTSTVPTGGENTKLAISSTDTNALVIEDGTQGEGYVLMSDANGVGKWVNTGGLGKVYNSTVAQTFPGAGVGVVGGGPGAFLQTSSPINITNTGTYTATLRWWGAADGPDATSKNVSAYISLFKNGTMVDMIEYYYTTAGSMLAYTFDVTLLAPNCNVGDVLTMKIAPSSGDMSKARNWYSGAAGTNYLLMPSVLITRL